MTNSHNILDPIRPEIGEAGNNVPSEGVGSMHGQEDRAEAEVDENEYRAEVEQVVRKPKPATRPYTPTRADIYKHEVTHLPYRNWCRHDVHGSSNSNEFSATGWPKNMWLSWGGNVMVCSTKLRPTKSNQR